MQQNSTATTTTNPASAALRLGREISARWRKEAMQPSQHAANESILRALQTSIEKEWPGQGLTLEAFGSSVTGLGTSSSDLDLVLLDPSRPEGRWTAPVRCKKKKAVVAYTHYDAGEWLPEWYNVTTLASVLQSAPHVKSTEAIHAIVPIVKLHIECQGRMKEVDISINNLFSVHNTQLLATYVALQPGLLPPLYFGIRTWFKARGLNDSTGKQTGTRTMSSYAIVLLVVKFLQEKNQLPNLQHEELLAALRPSQRVKLRDGYEGKHNARNFFHAAGSMIKTWDCSFVDPLDEHAEEIQVVAMDAWRAFIRKDASEAPLPSFETWHLAWESLRDTPRWRDLPHPSAVGPAQPAGWR